MPLQIFDRHGNPQDWPWLQAKFGDVSYAQSQHNLAYRLVRIHERQGHASHIVHLLDANDHPIRGVTVIRYWPDAPPLPPWDPPPERYFDRGVHGETNPDGNIGFGMGRGDLYHPPEPGASSAWVGELGVGSDCFHGLGWIVDPEDGDLHLDLTYQRTEGEPTPPPPDFETQVLADLATIIELLKDTLDWMQEQ